MGGPRKRSIRRRIAAKSARGTATSASWKTTYRPCRTIRAPIFTSFSRKGLHGGNGPPGPNRVQTLDVNHAVPNLAGECGPAGRPDAPWTARPGRSTADVNLRWAGSRSATRSHSIEVDRGALARKSCTAVSVAIISGAEPIPIKRKQNNGKRRLTGMAFKH